MIQPSRVELAGGKSSCEQVVDTLSLEPIDEGAVAHDHAVSQGCKAEVPGIACGGAEHMSMYVVPSLVPCILQASWV